MHSGKSKRGWSRKEPHQSCDYLALINILKDYQESLPESDRLKKVEDMPAVFMHQFVETNQVLQNGPDRCQAHLFGCQILRVVPCFAPKLMGLALLLFEEE